jgi:hypothetical protein
MKQDKLVKNKVFVQSDIKLFVSKNRNNAIIAKYMKNKEDAYYPTLWIIKNHINHNGNNYFWEGNLQYKENWDWIMPVVKKIFKTKDKKLIKPVQDALLTLNLKKIYKSVVNFIKTKK